MPAVPVSLRLSVDLGADAGADEIDAATRSLARELEEAGADRAELAVSDAPLPKGAKSGVATVLGNILLAAAPALLPKLVDLLKDWGDRSRHRSVKISAVIDGKPMEIALSGAGGVAEAERLIALLRQPTGGSGTA